MNISSNEYKRLGDRIRQNPDDIASGDLDAIQDLRSSYKDELATLFSILIKAARQIDKKAIVTYRVKRIESIISKLIRQPKMHVNRMADIAGCRCIVESDEHVWKVYEELRSLVQIINVNDYITSPKKDGYRSLHLNVKVDSQSNKIMEIQIRSVDEHNWATLVEITDLVFSSKIKEKGEGEMAEFHRMLSKDINSLSTQEKYKIFEIAKAQDYFNKVSSIFSRNYIEVRKSYNQAKVSGAKFFLLATGEDGTPDIKSYTDFDKAEQEYYQMFKENKQNKNIVMTYIFNASFEEISMAYSNYFLTFNALFFKCYQLLSSIVAESYKGRDFVRFYHMYSLFLDFTRHLFSVHLRDYLELSRSRLVLKSVNKRKNWQDSIRKHLNAVTLIFNDTQLAMNVKGQRINRAIKSFLVKRFLDEGIKPI